MTPRFAFLRALASATLLACAVSPLAEAATFRKSILLDAYKDLHQYPRVHSYCSAELLDNFGGRLYSPVILGHSVGDYNLQLPIFSSQVSGNGYASSTTRNLSTGQDILGDYDHCYGADMGAHANAYNTHEILSAIDKCMGPEPPDPPPFDKYTPILIDLQMDGYHLSGPDPAVQFDLNADGQLDRTAWTAAGEDDAFLCMDRNGNGKIDDGKELFGSATPLLSGEAMESGYYALAELDEPEAGGNGDGQVDSQDSMFEQLCVWIDSNRDAISQRQEIKSLAAAGIIAFERRFKTMHRMDDFGNLFRYTSRVYLKSTGGATSWATFDVIFAVPE